MTVSTSEGPVISLGGIQYISRTIGTFRETLIPQEGHQYFGVITTSGWCWYVWEAIGMSGSHQ